MDPAGLPLEFQNAYQAVTPFDESPGPYAAPAYDAFQLLWLALDSSSQTNQPIDRRAVGHALAGLEHHGLSGVVHQGK